MTKVKILVGLILLVIFLFFIFLFQNLASVPVNFLFWGPYNLSLSLLMVEMVVVGMVFMMLISMYIKLSKKIKMMQKESKEVETPSDSSA